MSKPVGVIASAIVAMLGSILALMAAVFVVAAPSIEMPPSQPLDGISFVIAGAVMLAVLGGIGIWTSVGLFRLRSWARTSILVCAGFLAAGSLSNLLLTMAVPLPPSMDGASEESFRRIGLQMFGIPFAIAVWWLIQFNMPSTKAAFLTTPAETASPRPLSITIIAWISIVGGASSVFPMLVRAPMFLFGAIFSGWIAGITYALSGALSLYIGKGLLDLREQARKLAIGWLGFWSLHMGLVVLVPSWRQRLVEMERTVAPGRPDQITFDPTMLMNLTFAISAVVVAFAIWLLIRNQNAFTARGTLLTP